MVRIMYHQCKLVHANSSEYNILYHDDHLFITDVSQSVEHDHPSAYDFLRSDVRLKSACEKTFAEWRRGWWSCKLCPSIYQKQDPPRLGVPALGLKQTFDFVTDKSISILHTEEELIELVQKLISSPQPQSVQDGAKTVELTHEASKSTKILDHERSEENNTNEAVF
ncbi:hypothetical protein PSTG_14481 [Puccinia striiformis f. sp. tritici PST-78]|uniref:non-specific serine/threonine protein kinase n=1 Tax=Puccinia striiformis f. sp. tritici PST-78 TaxID=1165861 RepID=A0A0L0UYK2_9BASI|nr:hypothetical protein PSTG_14481 [Puccinia striiformis f. sp. tritici PST-78]